MREKLVGEVAALLLASKSDRPSSKLAEKAMLYASNLIDISVSFLCVYGVMYMG